jgi:hypothetical protein
MIDRVYSTVAKALPGMAAKLQEAGGGIRGRPFMLIDQRQSSKREYIVKVRVETCRLGKEIQKLSTITHD